MMITIRGRGRRLLGLFAALCAVLVFAASCGDDDSGADASSDGSSTSGGGESSGDEPASDDPAPAEPQTITVAYNATGDFPEPDNTLTAAKESFEAANPGVTVELEKEVATETDFRTKVQLRLSSGGDIPDVLYYLPTWVAGDAAAGYLSPLDDDLAEWDDWQTVFPDPVRASVRDVDGHTYAVPLSSNVIGIWYNRNVFAEAGLPDDWQPETWADLRDAAQTIKDNIPDSIPAHLYVGKASGTIDAIQKTFVPLLYGTGDSLYDFDSGLWQPAGDGFVDTMAFISDMYSSGLHAPEADVLSPTVWSFIGPWMQENRLGYVIDGNWMSFAWVDGGPFEWPEWGESLGVAAVPTQEGGSFISMGVPGPVLVRSAESDSPELAMEFMKHVASRDLAMTFAEGSGQLAVRTDVLEDQAYVGRPTVPEFTSLLEYAAYVPLTEERDKVDLMMVEIIENVALGNLTPQEAADSYNDEIEELVGSALYAG